jgi:hypothetical protein
MILVDSRWNLKMYMRKLQSFWPFFFEWLKQVLLYVGKRMGKPTYTTFQLGGAIASNISLQYVRFDVWF